MSITKGTEAGVCRVVYQIAGDAVTTAGIVTQAVLFPRRTRSHLGQVLSVTHSTPSEVMAGQRRKDAHYQ